MPNASVGYVQAFRCERRRTDAQTRRRLRQLSSSEARKRRGDNKFHFLRVRHGSGGVRLLAGCKQGHGYSICRIRPSSFTHTHTHTPSKELDILVPRWLQGEGTTLQPLVPRTIRPFSRWGDSQRLSSDATLRAGHGTSPDISHDL